jgi:hypothetical protein
MSKLRNPKPQALRLNREKLLPPVLRSNREKSFQWFWGQITDTPSTLVLMLNQEIYTLRLHVHDADRIRRHSTSRSSGHRVPDLWDHPRSSALGLILLLRSFLLPAMLHISHAHHETSKRDSPHEQDKCSGTTKMSWIQIQTSQSQSLITLKPRN